MKTCVLYFGSFNPVHYGHLSVAGYLAGLPETDEVRIIPSPQNPLKDKNGLANPETRLEQVRLAFAGISPKISVSDVEYGMPRPNYTINTLQYLSRTEPDTRFILLMGADNLEILERWYKADEIIHKYEIWVYPRPGYDITGFLRKYISIPGIAGIRYIQDAPVFNISSTEIRQNTFMDNYQFEICANSVESCIAAQAAGADRVELCAAIPEGGTTPSIGDITVARRLLSTTRLHVIIRPRGGDFLYSDTEIEIMLCDINAARKAGADGVVFGCLDRDGNVDIPTMERLMEASEGLSVTFHRAFDVCRDPKQALEDIISLGCNRILTSGAESDAEKGIRLLRELNTQTRGRIAIMAGCGVNEKNIARIQHETGILQFHFSARENIESGMAFRNGKVSMGGTVHIDEYSRPVTTEARVRAIMDVLK